MVSCLHRYNTGTVPVAEHGELFTQIQYGYSPSIRTWLVANTGTIRVESQYPNMVSC
ncbi:hypothetical protein MAR_032873 [Mya arenaria]|uniref:Uncharacterized protein n=1 Tax=Mya arenaria TaxID=6604 RepID=A0ABY7GBI7_MYAAR|nr:hypothetical protein MAR_032873 [Mya arenaria]